MGKKSRGGGVGCEDWGKDVGSSGIDAISGSNEETEYGG